MTINHAEAIRLYTQAAQQGHPTAQNCLGLCYINGIVVVSSSSNDDGDSGNAVSSCHGDYHVNHDG